MLFDVHGALLVAVVAGVTALIRFLPFVVFGAASRVIFGFLY